MLLLLDQLLFCKCRSQLCHFSTCFSQLPLLLLLPGLCCGAAAALQALACQCSTQV
jgi:hypothetical protein